MCSSSNQPWYRAEEPALLQEIANARVAEHMSHQEYSATLVERLPSHMAQREVGSAYLAVL